jgi:hypothetical protein
MGKQRNSKLVGTLGNVIFYNFRGDYCMRTKPVSVQRTEASINSGFNFGRASKISAQIRKAIVSINPAKSDMKVLYRLTAAMNKFISWKEKKEAASIKMPDKLPFIHGFQFNDQSDLSSITSIKPNVNNFVPGHAEINFLPFVPSQNLQAPANSKSINLKIILLRVSLRSAETDILGKNEIEIPNSSESFQPPIINMETSAKPGDLMMLIVAVQYMVNKNGVIGLMTDKKKMPCGIGWVGIF